MVAIVPLLYVGWKVLKRSTFYKLDKIDLVKNLDEIEDYEASYMPQPPEYVNSCLSPHLLVTLSCQWTGISDRSSRNAFEKILDRLFG